MYDTTTNIFEETPDMDTVGGRLSRARDAGNLSARDLAWRLGVKIATVKAWETDRSQPGAHRLTALSGLLNVSLSWILHGVGTGPTETERPVMLDTANAQVEKLKDLHAETGTLIARLEREMRMMRAPQQPIDVAN